MGIFRLRRMYSIYDETDNLKRMKDSDILAERKKSNESYTPVVGSALKGAVGGAALGAGIGAIAGSGVSGIAEKASSMGKGALKGGKWGAIAGGLALGAHALSKRSERQDEADKYNNRLNYAQAQARRREKADWKRNMTTRDGYSY